MFLAIDLCPNGCPNGYPIGNPFAYFGEPPKYYSLEFIIKIYNYKLITYFDGIIK